MKATVLQFAKDLQSRGAAMDVVAPISQSEKRHLRSISISSNVAQKYSFSS
jgi:hypothetical protein